MNCLVHSQVFKPRAASLVISNPCSLVHLRRSCNAFRLLSFLLKEQIIPLGFDVPVWRSILPWLCQLYSSVFRGRCRRILSLSGLAEQNSSAPSFCSILHFPAPMLLSCLPCSYPGVAVDLTQGHHVLGQGGGLETDPQYSNSCFLSNSQPLYCSKLLFIDSLNFPDLGSLLVGNLCAAQISGQCCVCIHGLDGIG